MQPNLVYRAEHQVHNHDFLLAAMAIKAVHRLHRSAARTEDTLKEVLAIVANGEPVELPPVGMAPNNPSVAVPVGAKKHAGTDNVSSRGLPKAA